MNHCKLYGKGLVIQLSGHELRVALMSLGARPKLLHGAVFPMPPGIVEDGTIRDLDMLAAVLKNRLSEPEFRHTRRVIFSLCTTQVLTETVKTPELPDSRLERLLQSNMDVYFPVNTGDYHLVWQKNGTAVDEKGKKTMSVQLWAVPRVLIGQYYKLAAACSLTVLAMDYCGHSAVLALETDFALAEKGKKAPIQSAPVDEDASVQLHFVMEREHLLLTFVQSGRALLQRLIRRGLGEDSLFSEIFMVLEYYRSMEDNRHDIPITGLLSGSQATVEILPDMEAALGIPMELHCGMVEPQWLLCMGAARTALDFGDSALTRSGKRLRRTVGGTGWQYLPLLVGLTAAVFAVALNIRDQRSWDRAIYDLEDTQLALRIQSGQTENFAQNYYTYLSKYEKYSADWDLVFSSLRTYNDNLLLVLNELEDTIPATSSVVSMSISADGMDLQFACPDKEEAAYLIMSLRSLQYASLNSVSSLTGGGGGPHISESVEADSGDDQETTEESAVVLSARVILQTEQEPVTYAAGSLADLAQIYLGQSMGKETIMDRLSSMNPQQLEALEASYGRLPTVSHSMEELVARATEAQRKAAMSDMLRTNPFAAYRFMRLLEQDIYRPAGTEILYGWIRKDLMLPENQMMILDILSGNIRNAATMQNYLERLAAMVTKDAETLAATEKLISTDAVVTRWYTYYLEVVLGLRQQEDTPFLDQDKMIVDALGGGFHTGDAELDDILNGLLPSVPGIPSDGTGGDTTQPTEPADTRIFFSVSLGYRQELMDAELERKGMPQTEKISPLEVTE